MKFLRDLLQRSRNDAPPATLETEPEASTPGHGQKWHHYEQPITRAKFTVFNATENMMPLEIVVEGKVYAKVAPFSGVDGPWEEKPGNFIYRYCTLEERNRLVERQLTAQTKRIEAMGMRPAPIHKRRSDLHAKAAKQCVIARVVGPPQ